MKSQTQTLVLIAVFIVIIGGMAFVSNWIGPKSRNEGPDPNPTGPELVFPVKMVEGNPQFEAHTRGYWDYYFQNPSDQALELGLEKKHCQCSEVKVLLLDPAEDKKIRSRLPADATAQVVAGADGLFQLLAPVAALDREVSVFQGQPERWKVLVSEKSEANDSELRIIPVPGHASGIVRLGWRGENPGPKGLSARMWTQVPGNPKTRSADFVLSIGALLVPPVEVNPDKVTVGDLNPGQQHEFELVCWSATRPGFKVESVKEESGNPCFQASFQPLTGRALEKAVADLTAKRPARVATAYRVNVTVYERLPNDSAQLDLGPFKHHLLLATDQIDVPPLRIEMSGTVRGDVTVGTEEFRDKIVLKTWRRDKDKEEIVPVETSQPGLKLRIDHWEPKYLEVELKDRGEQRDGRWRWDLRVKVPRNKASGEMRDSAGVLVTETQPPRRIRIPIHGRALAP
jgi:hypothetical protein